MKKKQTGKFSLGFMLAGLAMQTSIAAPISVLWWDSTPDYGGQAPNSLRAEMATYLDTFDGGTTFDGFDATYVGSETAGTFATHMATHSYDVIVFDATSSASKFNAADMTAITNHYQDNRNLVLDGTLYIRSINYNAATDFPGPGGAMGGLTANEVYQLGVRGGGILIGTDHSGFQTDANQALHAILPSANFSGITYPSTDGVFYGTDMLNGAMPIAAADVFSSWDAVPTEAIAPTGSFTNIFGDVVTMSSQVDVADDPGGGPRYSYISTSWAPGTGTTDVTDETPGGVGGTPGAVPEPGTFALMGLGLAGMAFATRRKLKK